LAKQLAYLQTTRYIICSFEWSKLTDMTNWASQCIAAKIDCDLCWNLWSVNYCGVV